MKKLARTIWWKVNLKLATNQCQLQMGVTGLKLCYFSVYTAHGFLIDQIEFDDGFYKELIDDCCLF